MVLQAYYDGSGKSAASDYITLAGIAAPEVLWPAFEARWKEVVARHGLRWWHTSPAMTGIPERAEFVEPCWRHRWNRARASAAGIELFNLIHRFHWDEWRHGFQILTCTVDMAGYKSARAANPLLRPAEAICVNTCVGRLGLHEPAARIRLCFDRNEAFMRQVEQVWSKDRKKPNVRWARQVEEIAPGDAKSTPGLQAADLLAWHVNRGWATADIPMLLSINGIVCRRYDRKKIERAYPPDRERRRKEGIDRAKRKTSETQPHAERAMDT